MQVPIALRQALEVAIVFDSKLDRRLRNEGWRSIDVPDREYAVRRRRVGRDLPLWSRWGRLAERVVDDDDSRHVLGIACAYRRA